MNHGSLFSGIGGFDLAAEWMGWNNLFHCEWNEFGQKILKHYWPNAKQFGDITKSTFLEFQGKCDILTGGFPCQPFSAAGKRQGTDDNRYLWPEMLRAIREIKPRWIVGENVRGLINWNEGLVFDKVCTDLESEGYEVIPLLLPAASVNAPHKRERIWFVAYSNSSLLEYRNRERKAQERTFTEERIKSFICTENWQAFPIVSPIHIRNDGLSNRLDGITFSKWRKESIKGAGNAIVPQVAYNIFKVIQMIENDKT